MRIANQTKKSRQAIRMDSHSLSKKAAFERPFSHKARRNVFFI